MRIEIRSSGGEECPVCGTTAPVMVQNQAAARDLTRELEREILRRELAVMKMLRVHLDRTDEAVENEMFMLIEQHRLEFNRVKERLEASKVDVAGWRLARRRREKLFAARIDRLITELFDSTRMGGVDPEDDRRGHLPWWEKDKVTVAEQ